MDARKDFLDSYFKGFKSLFPSLTEEEFMSYYDESTYSGYPIEPGGSMWESEGKSVYVLIRILKPKTILEIGNYIGVSANHILQAVEMNGFGKVVLLDIEERLNYANLHSKNFERVLNDSLKYLENEFNFDLILQDGNHEYAHVKTEINLILKNNKNPNFHVWAHDYYCRNRAPQCEVWRAWDENLSKFSLAVPFKDSISDCGFIISRK